jgi:hypothetical protein
LSFKQVKVRISAAMSSPSRSAPPDKYGVNVAQAMQYSARRVRLVHVTLPS